MSITVAIAEDKELSMRSCVQKLSVFPDLKVVIQAANGASLTRLLEQCLPDIILMDIEMPVMDGISATEIIKKAYPQVKILILTTFDDDDKIFRAILAGASGYILKEENAATLHQAIVDTMAGGASMSPGIALKALNLIRNPIDTAALHAVVNFDLTKREIELLEQLKNGLSYEKIGANLFISYGTVRKHIENIYRKLNVTNKLDAVQKAGRNRII